MHGEHQGSCRTSRKLVTDSELHVKSSKSLPLVLDIQNGMSNSLLARRGFRISVIVPEVFKGYRQALLERGYSLGSVLGRSSANQSFTVVAAEKEGRRFAAKGTSEHEKCGVLTATLRREYDILRDLSHPGIVHAEELIECTGGCAMVMELCRGVCVERLMPKGTTLSGLGRHAVLGALLDAVAYLHREQIAHRDLHALNVVVDTQTLNLGTAGGLNVGGAVKILDFGSAWRITVGGDSSAICRFGDMASLDILPPERGSNGDCPFACDVFAVGLLAAGLAVGRPLLSADVVRREVLRVPERCLAIGELGIEHLHLMLSLSPETRPPAFACAESLPPADSWLA
jgi:serine/threonine protein kinase